MMPHCKIENGWYGRHITGMVLVQLCPYRSLQTNTNVFLLIAVILWWNISILMWVVSFRMAISPSPKGFWKRHKLYAIVFTIINTIGLTILDWHLRLCSLQSLEPKLKEYIFEEYLISILQIQKLWNYTVMRKKLLIISIFLLIICVYNYVYFCNHTNNLKWQKNMTSFFL